MEEQRFLLLLVGFRSIELSHLARTIDLYLYMLDVLGEDTYTS